MIDVLPVLFEWGPPGVVIGVLLMDRVRREKRIEALTDMLIQIVPANTKAMDDLARAIERGKV